MEIFYPRKWNTVENSSGTHNETGNDNGSRVFIRNLSPKDTAQIENQKKISVDYPNHALTNTQTEELPKKSTKIAILLDIFVGSNKKKPTFQ